MSSERGLLPFARQIAESLHVRDCINRFKNRDASEHFADLVR